MEDDFIREYDRENEGFDNIAVAIKLISPEMQQRHLGMLIKPEPNEPAKLLHLASHNDFRLDDEVGNGYYFLETCKGMIPQNVEGFVDWLSIMWEENKDGIPYGLLYNDKDRFFDNAGQIKELKPGMGFTCSSFVLECFKCFGFDLIKHSSWPVRQDDAKWAERIYFFLENYCAADEEHIRIQREKSDIVRFRPEEVAAAANMSKFDNVLLEFDDIEPLSIKITQHLNC